MTSAIVVESVECALLSVVMCDETGHALAAAFSAGVELAHFADPSCRAVWQAMVDVGAEASGDPSLVNAKLRDNGHPKLAAFVAELIDVPRTESAEAYARLVIRDAERRQVQALARKIIEAENGVPSEATIAALRRLLDGPRAVASKRFRVISTQELLDAAAAPADGLFAGGLLDQAGVAILNAPPKRGKTYLAIHAAISIATGVPFLRFTVATPAPVLYINAEVGLSRFATRVAAGLESLGDEVVERFAGHFFSVTRPEMDLSGRADFAVLEREVRRIGARFVVIDPVSSVWFGDENDAGEVSKFFAGIRHLANETGASFLLCHHSGKHTKDVDESYHSRGSGVWASAPETIITMRGVKREKYRHHLSIRGTNIAEELEIEYNQETSLFRELDPAIDAPSREQGTADGNAHAAFDAIKKAGVPLSLASIQQATGMGLVTAKRAASRAAELGLIVNVSLRRRDGASYDLTELGRATE